MQKRSNAALSLSSVSLDFGKVVVGNSKALTITATNGTSAGLIVTGISVSSSSFSYSGPSLPLTIPSGGNATLNLAFAPSGAGNTSGTISIANNLSGEPSLLQVSGDGVSGGHLSASPTSVNFGNVQIGTNKTATATLSNTGGSDLTISQAQMSGTGFQFNGLNVPVTLSPGQGIPVTLTFSPRSGGNSSGTLMLTDDVSSSELSKHGAVLRKRLQGNGTTETVMISVSGDGVTQGQLAASPSSLNFGNVTTGTTQNQNLTVSNAGGISVTISQATVTGSGFSVSGLNLPLTLGPAQSSTFSVSFSPKAAGAVSGNIAMASDASNSPFNISLAGVGAAPGALSASPSSVSFGTVQVGNNQKQTITLTNSGGTTLTVSQANVTGTGFSITGLTLPLTLGAGQSSSFTATFAPQASGSATGNIALLNTGSTGTLNVPLSGTGVAAGALTASPSSLSFGSVQDGNTASLTETLTNTGGTSVTINQSNVTGTGFNVTGLNLPITLSAGQSTSFTVTFGPQSPGAVSGNIAISSNASNPTLNVPLSGTGVTQGTLAANPTSVSFGNVTVGNTATVSETVTNSGGSSLTLNQANVSGSGFNFNGLSLPLTLTPGQSKTFNVTFNPQAAGSASGNLALVNTGSVSTLNIPLAGTGIAPGTLSANPSTLSFGNVQVGNSANLSETLTNTGGTSITVSQANITGTGFTVSGLSLPVALGAGQSTTFTVVFSPQSSGTKSGNLAIVSNASNPTLNIALSGTGFTPGTLSASPTSVNFGNVTVGNSASVTETLTNTGGSNLTINQANPTGTGFTLSGLSLPLTLTPGQSTTFSITFAPQSSGAASGNVALINTGSAPTVNIPLAGTGATQGAVSPNPSSLSFGTVQAGSSSNLNETLTNTGGSSVTISQATASGTGFSISGINPPVTLTAGQSYTFTATFAPQGSGSASGTIAIVSNGSNPNLNIAMSGTGGAPGQLSVNPTSLSFGNVTVGNSSTLTASLTAAGASVTVSSAGVSNGEFTLSGLTFPFTLAAGQSQTFNMTFTPGGTGPASGTATFTSNATNSPTALSFSGTGTAPVQHSVDLSWNASVSQVAGYNIYRGTVSGGPYTRLNSGLESSTSYTDSTPQAGQTYFYVTTAVDDNGTESSFSNQAQAVIPSP